ncbi:MAG TPA: hypothetical protein VFN42_08335 [Acetobacteraceae bacterium]|nr:hypothetical protein [Acetobacteraceae bacterium]
MRHDAKQGTEAAQHAAQEPPEVSPLLVGPRSELGLLRLEQPLKPGKRRRIRLDDLLQQGDTG